MQATITMRERSAAIITLRRLIRSLTTPAKGPMKVCGSTCNISARATEEAFPVYSSSKA